MQLKKPNRPGWEYAVIACVVMLSMWMSLALYAKRDQVAKGEILRWELLTFRNAVVTYILETKTTPKSLEQAVCPLLRPEFVEGSVVHCPLSYQDPFGSPYHYNSKTGWVSSTTPQYRQW